MDTDLVRVESHELREVLSRGDEVLTRTLSTKLWIVRVPLVGTMIASLLSWLSDN